MFYTWFYVLVGVSLSDFNLLPDYFEYLYFGVNFAFVDLSPVK